MARPGAGIIVYFTDGKGIFVLLGKESKHLTYLEDEFYDLAFTHVKDIISGGGAVMQNDVLYLTGYNSKSQIILYFFNLRGHRGGLSRKYKRFMRGRKNTRGSRMRE